ncbi:hypothetical protein BD324DRAFT_629168 [Kockovaella imperatae]|uniref:DUF4185 domain-containing protein n=1 Tax=Kockovaella imperatae TaxID=4999 RepID=A0A1Y1UG78_9TREE|nr:hypothetical protein BD324DRAFT_629168 [Kockovaella imperatae]ORX36516.1 hypothetical protein BD324DRAFT_629168 [Kockovaella imperatae]
MLQWLFALSTALPSSFSAPAPATVPALTLRENGDAVIPKVKNTTLYGPVTDPSLVRDSCGSVGWNAGRVLWVCRDTQNLGTDGLPTFPVYTSSASYTDFNSDGSIPWQSVPTNPFNYMSEWIMYGNNQNRSFYPIQYDECNSNQAGQCGDMSRYALWPDYPPMVSVINADGSILAYTWIKKSHITPDLSSLVADPAATLYRVWYQPEVEGTSGPTLPEVEVVQEQFWPQNSFAYGDYGNIVRNGTAYLYAQSSNGTISLAKVGVNDVEDRSKYQYWVNNSWTSTVPALNTSGIQVNATYGGQGTFYYSYPWQSYVWIGQQGHTVDPDFWITTAPEPYGPWTTPTHILSVQAGNYSLGAYSMQAHPALVSSPWTNEIYVSYTKNDIVQNKNLYTQPLIKIEWE